MNPRHPECPCCTCGMVRVTWSDRGVYLDPTNADEIVDAVVSCISDGRGDREGAPWGMPSDLRDAIIRVVRATLYAEDQECSTSNIDVSRSERTKVESAIREVVVAWLAAHANPAVEGWSQW